MFYLYVQLHYLAVIVKMVALCKWSNALSSEAYKSKYKSSLPTITTKLIISSTVEWMQSKFNKKFYTNNAI